MHYLIYISNSKLSFLNDEIIGIVNTCRLYNKKFNITGLFLYHDGSMLHVLEGEKEKVHELYYNKLSKDKRHKDLIILLDDEIEKRSFTDWSVGFNKSQNREWSDIEGCLDIGNRNEFSQLINPLSPELVSIIQSFSDVNRIHI